MAEVNNHYTRTLAHNTTHLETGAGDDEHGEVVLERVARLDAVLEEEGAAHDVVEDVVLHDQIVGTVHVHGPVEAAVHAAATHVGAVHPAVQVEVDGVSAEPERLARVGEFDVLDASNYEIFVRPGSVQHHLGAELVRPKLLTEAALEARLYGELTCNENMEVGTRRVVLLMSDKDNPDRSGIYKSSKQSRQVYFMRR